MYTSHNPSFVFSRDLPGDVDNVRNTFSSWDSCMAEDYCKWPVIVGIIIGSLIVISVIWCCARCLCCGAECCCACCSCFNACCPSPRKKNDGYQKPQQYPPYNQYQSPQPPVYFGAGGHGGYNGPQTATFDAPSGRGKYNEDALPAMPSWGTATSRRVEEKPSDVDIEMEKMDQAQHSPQNQSLLPQHTQEESAEFDDHHAGDIGEMPAGGHYADYNPNLQGNNTVGGGYYSPPQSNGMAGGGYDASYQQTHNTSYYNTSHEMDTGPYSARSPQQAGNPYYDFSQRQRQNQQQQYFGSPTSPTAASSVYPPTYHTRPPSTQHSENSYGAPPTYRTAPPAVSTPPPPGPHARMPSAGSYAVERKPLSGSWRDV